MFDVVVSNPPYRTGSDRWKELTNKHQRLTAGEYALVCPVDNMTKEEVRQHCQTINLNVKHETLFTELIYIDTEVYYYIWEK